MSHPTGPCVWIAALFASVFLLLSITAFGADELCVQLEPLRSFLGSWIGVRSEEPDRPWIYRTWESILDGYAIRDLRSVPMFEFDAETFVYVDCTRGGIQYTDITDNGFVTHGEISCPEAHQHLYEGLQTTIDGAVRSVRSLFVFSEDGSLTEQFWSLEDGVWREGHRIIYTLAPEGD